jgi:hypothetical protein
LSEYEELLSVIEMLLSQVMLDDDALYLVPFVLHLLPRLHSCIPLPLPSHSLTHSESNSLVQKINVHFVRSLVVAVAVTVVYLSFVKANIGL